MDDDERDSFECSSSSQSIAKGNKYYLATAAGCLCVCTLLTCSGGQC